MDSDASALHEVQTKMENRQSAIAPETLSANGTS